MFKEKHRFLPTMPLVLPNETTQPNPNIIKIFFVSNFSTKLTFLSRMAKNTEGSLALNIKKKI
jgi:hypothetical protein